MKCPQCGGNQRYRDGMICPCGYRFTLDPKRDRISDGRFLALTKVASGNDTYYFTQNQLAAADCRRAVKGRGWIAFLIVIVGGLGLAGAVWAKMGPGGNMASLGLMGLGVVVLIGIAWLTMAWRPDQSRFEAVLRKWQAANQPLPRLLTEPSLHQPPPEWPEPDIYDYGVEAILIVQRDILVDLFVKNEFHAAHRCLVISESGYPAYLVPRASALLREREDLPVYLLHDATPTGVGMIDRLQRKVDLPVANHPLFDVGLFPEDVKRIARLRPMLPARHDYGIAVDYIGYAMLASGLGVALEQQTTLAGVLDAQGLAGYEASSFG